MLLDHDLDNLLGIDPIALIDFERKNQCDPEFCQSPRARDSWVGLDSTVLNTSYQDLFDLLTSLDLPAGTRILDLGSGFGRLGLVIGLGFSKLEFTGVECWQHRIQPAQNIAEKMNMSNVRFEHSDLLDPNYVIPEADIYFCYLTSSEATSLKAILDKLLKSQRQRSYKVITKKISPKLMKTLAPTLVLKGSHEPFFLYHQNELKPSL